MGGNPKFKNPPVVETVLGVQFPEIDGFRAAHFGLYWEAVRDRFPKVSDHPRLEPVRERFPSPPVIPGPRLELLQRIPTGRSWYTAASGSELIQLQADRFLFNWRSQDENGEYPSYKTNSKIFFAEFEAFCDFCRGLHELEEPLPEMCEVTYVNHIDPTESETGMELAGKLFSGVAWERTDGFLPLPERFTFNRTFVIEDSGKPVGRLYAEASMAYRREQSGNREFVLLKVTARVNHDADGEKRLTDSMQLAHDWVVRGFADLTTKQIQDERWERQQ